MQNNLKNKTSFYYAALGLGILLIIWWIGSSLLAQTLPIAKSLAPAPTFKNLYLLLSENQLTHHIISSLQRVFVGLSLALLIAVPLGILIGQYKRLEQLTSGSFQFLRMISPLSWMPIIVMLFGIGNNPIYFLLTFAAIWPILLNTIYGVKSINPQWQDLGKSLTASRLEMLIHIIFPAVFSHVLTGLRLSIGIVWILLVPCEMLGVNDGLGYFILDTRDRFAYSELMAVIVLIGFIGWLLDLAIRFKLRANN